MIHSKHGRTALMTALALCSCVALTSCSLPASPPVPPNRDTLRIPLYGQYLPADPTLAETPASLFLASLLYSGLMKYGPDLHVIPDLAVSIPTISDDGRTYTFTVRQDARFSDGTHCTASDVAYSLSRALSPGVHSALARHYLGNIQGAGEVERGETSSLAGVQVIDRLTLSIHLVHADASFLEKLAYPVASVVDRRVLRLYPRQKWAGSPAGTGPWAVIQQSARGALILRARPHSYGGPLQLKEIMLTPVQSAATALDLYHRGLLDVARVPAGEYARLSAGPDFHSSASLDAYYALPDPAGDPIALAEHLDRDELIRQSSAALSALQGIVPPAVPDYVSSPPSLDAAAAAEVPDVAVQLATPSDPTARLLQQSLHQQWPKGRGGITVRLVHVTSFLPDPAVWLRIVLQQTHSRWYRSILARSSRLTNDPVSRMSAYSRGENWALEKGLVIPLASGSIGFLIKPRVRSLQVTPIGIMPENNSWASVSVT